MGNESVYMEVSMGDSRDETIQKAYDTNAAIILDQKYIRNNYDEGELRVDRETGEITLLLRWRFNWIRESNVINDWTELEKTHFVLMAYSVIRQVWNGKVSFSVSGYSDFAKKFSGKKLPFKIEIIPVNRNWHWWVNVHKINPGDYIETFVYHAFRTIQLKIRDISGVYLCDNGDVDICESGQIQIAHEVGHVVGWLGTDISGNKDEYYGSEKERRERLPDSSDIHALMNIGMGLRPRYLKTVTKRLSEMFSDAVFSPAIKG